MNIQHSMPVSDLLTRHCAPRPAPLTAQAVAALLAQMPEWHLDNGKLCREFGFANYYQTIAFVNALAYLTHAQDHHPELTITYQNCLVRYDTHQLADGQAGLSDNDFICAARASAVYRDGLHAAPAARS